jgi:hypothetical protein
MASFLANLVRESSTNPGTGTFALNGSPAGYVPFVQAFGTGASCFYVARSADLTLTEIGRGTITAGTPNTLSRDRVIWNSQVLAANPTKLSFTGTLDVYCEIPAERMPLLADDGSLSLSVGGGAPALVKRVSDFGKIYISGAGGTLTTSLTNQIAVGFVAAGPNLFVCALASLNNTDTSGSPQAVGMKFACGSAVGSDSQGSTGSAVGFLGAGGGTQVAQISCFLAISGLVVGTAYDLTILLSKNSTSGTVSVASGTIAGISY